MNDINKIGIRIGVITLIVIVLVFVVWKGAEIGISKYRTSNLSATPTTTTVPSPTTTPDNSSSLETAQEVSNITDTAQKTLVGYTKQYIESLPPEISKEGVLDQKTLQAFIDTHKGDLLPQLPEGTVKIITKSGKVTIQSYLDSIAPSHNKSITSVTGEDIITALAKQQSGEDLQALAPVRASVEKNFEIFKSVATPTETVEMHTKLLQATQALINNIKLLQDMRNDIVAGLIGQRNITDLNLVFADIAAQISALETKYNIK
jgi:hypothetical protein